MIQTTALTKVYPGDVTALNGLTVSFGRGVTGLIGANGAGKSTLIKVLLGLLEPTQGMAKVLGHDCVKDGELIRQMSVKEAKIAIRDGVATGGMIPKLETAIAAVESGVEAVPVAKNFLTLPR